MKGSDIMNRDIISVMQKKAALFSKGQRLLAKYITESYDKAAFMTASKLGKTVGVSESTVVRFAVELGYDGYPSMQKAMQEMVLNRLTSVQRIEVASDRIGNQDVVSMVLQSDADKLRQTAEILDRDEFRAAVQAISNAKRIYVLGARSAAPLANFLGYYLNFIFNKLNIVNQKNIRSSEFIMKFSHIFFCDMSIHFIHKCFTVCIKKI